MNLPGNLRAIAGMAMFVFSVAATPALAQDCWAGELFYSAGEYAELEEAVDRIRYARRELVSQWDQFSPRVATLANLYGALDISSVLVRPDVSAIEQAMSLSAAQRSAILQGQNISRSRLNRVLTDMRSGSSFGSRLGSALNFAGQSIDAVNIFYNAAEAVRTGSRKNKVQTYQASLSLGRARLAQRWGSSIGPMFAMTGLLEYSINTFASSAWDRYESYWWEGYRNYTDQKWNYTAEDWLAVYQNEGHEGISRRLMQFWNDDRDVNALAAMFQNERDSGPSQSIARSGYAITEYQQTFAARYMTEVVEPQIGNAMEAQADRALNQAIEIFNNHCDAALEEALAIDAAYRLIEEAGSSYVLDACPAPRPFQRGISDSVTEDKPNRAVRRLREQLDQYAGQGNFDLDRLMRIYEAELDPGLVTDVATDFSLDELEVRPTPDFHPAEVDLLLPPELLTQVWSGGPKSFGGALRKAHIAFGRAYGQLGANVLDDHFGQVNVIVDPADARAPLILYLTGFDFEYRNRAGLRTRWSGTGKLGVSACFEGQYVFEEHLQTEETVPHSRGSDFNAGDAMAVVAADVVRRTLDLAAIRVSSTENDRLQSYLQSEYQSGAEPVRFVVPEPPIAAAERPPLSDDEAVDMFESLIDRAADQQAY